MKHSHSIAPVVLGALCLVPLQPVVASSPYHGEVVVTATRTPVPVVDSLASVTTISRHLLDTRQPLDLAELFRQTPGLDINRSGGPGAVTSLYTRGTASGHTLILLDGQRISSATLGSTSFQYLNPDQIERIEVVRGARSSLYGSEAIGGVVQIFTRDGSGTVGSYASTAVGSHHLGKVAIGTSGREGGFRYGVHGSYLDTDGIDNQVDDAGFNSDRDGYRNKSINASAGYRFASGLDLRLRFLESENRNAYDSTFAPHQRPYSDSRLQNINAKASLPVSDSWLTQVSLGRSSDDSDDYDGVTGRNTGDFRTTREQLFWQNDVTIGDRHLATVGYDYYQDEVISANVYADGAGRPVKSRDNRAAFAQYQGSLSAFDLVLGAREEDNQEYGSHTTANVSLGLQLGESYRLGATWAEGFKAPTFNDLYWPGSGNPTLEPEQSENRELSLRGNYRLWHWSVAWFHNDVDNLIAWAPGNDFRWRPYNVNEAEINGGELLVGAILGGWQVDASYTYVEARDAATDNLLPNRSPSNFTLNVDRAFSNFRLGLSLKAQGRRYGDAGNNRELGGYGLLGLRAGYSITPALEASAKVDNLFAKDYRISDTYNQQGRTWQLGLTYRL